MMTKVRGNKIFLVVVMSKKQLNYSWLPENISPENPLLHASCSMIQT